jgi:hypothetical protein
MNARPLVVLAALAATAEPDLARTAADELKGLLKRRYAADPIGTTVASTAIAAWLFYRAERGKNPKVDSYYAALEYMTSSLSVGYTDIYPKTPAGKAIASAVMTFGPAMSGGILEDKSEKEKEDAGAIVDRLDRILFTLESVLESRA